MWWNHALGYNVGQLLLMILVAVKSNLLWKTQNISVRICKERDAHFNWEYELSEESRLVQMHWSQDDDSDITVYKDELFTTVKKYAGRVLYSINGSLTLKNCHMEDSGVYMLFVSFTSITTGFTSVERARGILEVKDWEPPKRKGKKIIDEPTGNETCRELYCFEDITFLGKPPVSYEWKHSKISVNGSMRGNLGYLPLCQMDPFWVEYTCRLSGDALLCLNESDNMKQTIHFKKTESVEMLAEDNDRAEGSVLLIIAVCSVSAVMSLFVSLGFLWRTQSTDGCQRHLKYKKTSLDDPDVSYLDEIEAMRENLRSIMSSPEQTYDVQSVQSRRPSVRFKLDEEYERSRRGSLRRIKKKKHRRRRSSLQPRLSQSSLRISSTRKHTGSNLRKSNTSIVPTSSGGRRMGISDKPSIEQDEEDTKMIDSEHEKLVFPSTEDSSVQNKITAVITEESRVSLQEDSNQEPDSKKDMGKSPSERHHSSDDVNTSVKEIQVDIEQR